MPRGIVCDRPREISEARFPRARAIWVRVEIRAASQAHPLLVLGATVRHGVLETRGAPESSRGQHMTTTTLDHDYPLPQYPVSVAIEFAPQGRNRLTTFARPILSIPHMILVGPGAWFHRLDSAGLLGAAAYVLAIVNWFAILMTGKSMASIRDFQLYYLRWRTRALAYMALFVDAYPPFGDAPYPAAIGVIEPGVARDRVTVAGRPILVLPHVVILFVLVPAWAVATFVAWLAILFTGRYPAALQGFGSGVMRWLLRVEAYLLLLVDEFPPFGFD
jgi:hypothetical protein